LRESYGDRLTTGGEFLASLTWQIVMATSIDALDLPVQLFALGTAMGMLAGLRRHRRTGEIDHWPVYVATYALLLFGFGLLVSGASALL